MKLIIDIPEQWRDDMVWENFDKVDELCQAILDGDIIPDNATNGDVIKAMFPNTEVMITDERVFLRNETVVMIYSLTWWNSPYQKGGRNERP